MEIAIGANTFFRRQGNDVFFVNPKSAASLVIADCGVLLDVLSRNFKEEEIIIDELSRKCHVQPETILSDFSPIILELVKCGLIVKKGSNYVDEQGRVRVPDESGSICDSSHTDDDPIGKFYRDRKLPLALHIDITSCCTERCVHCYLPNTATNHLDYRHIEKVLCEFREMAGLTAFISGGECMMHPDFPRILRKCRELELNIVILSNLTLCNTDTIGIMKEVSPQYVNVSLYSMDPEEHDRITTVAGSWNRTMSAILACQEAGINIRIATPLLSINRNAFRDLQRFANEHNMHLVPDFGIFAKCNHDVRNLRYACSGEELEDTLRKNKAIFDMGWTKHPIDDLEATMCDIGVFRIHLNSKGDFYPCPSMQGYVLGNVSKDAMKDVWYGEKLEYLRGIRWKHLRKCATCEHRAYCEPCLAYNFNATGDIFKIVPEKCRAAIVVHSVYGGQNAD